MGDSVLEVSPSTHIAVRKTKTEKIEDESREVNLYSFLLFSENIMGFFLLLLLF